jgi:hypothetical protein
MHSEKTTSEDEGCTDRPSSPTILSSVVEEEAGEAQDANQDPPRPDQPPGGSVCAPGGTARWIVPQTAFQKKEN